MNGKLTYANLDYLGTLTAGDRELMAEMIEIFIGQVPEFTEGLTSCLRDGDFPALGAMAHKAKSSVAALGMDSLAADLKKLELCARAGTDQELYPALVNRFVEQAELTCRELGEYLTKGKRAGGQEGKTVKGKRAKRQEGKK